MGIAILYFGGEELGNLGVPGPIQLKLNFNFSNLFKSYYEKGYCRFLYKPAEQFLIQSNIR